MAFDYPWALLLAAWVARGNPPGEAPPVCSSSGCLNVAQWKCFWPGQTCDKCHACKAKLSTVATALGFELSSRALNIPVGDDDTTIRGSLLELD